MIVTQSGVEVRAIKFKILVISVLQITSMVTCRSAFRKPPLQPQPTKPFHKKPTR
jgi:hypothetical protein